MSDEQILDGAMREIELFGEDLRLGGADIKELAGTGSADDRTLQLIAEQTEHVAACCDRILALVDDAKNQPETIDKKISPELQSAIEGLASAALYVKERAEVLVDAVRPGANSGGDEALVAIYRAADSVRSAAGNIENAVESRAGRDVTRAIDNLQRAAEMLTGSDYPDDVGQQIPSLIDEIVGGIEQLYAADEEYQQAWDNEPNVDDDENPDL